MSYVTVDIVKKRLIEIIKENVDFKNVMEWFWEDYGVKVGSWDKAVRVMLSDRVSLADLISFLEDNNVEVSLESLDMESSGEPL